MLGKKRWMFFRKLKKQTAPPTSSPLPSPSPSPSSSPSRRSSSSSWVPRWKIFWTASKWRKMGGIHVSFIHSVLFKVVSLFEAVVLVFTLAFFYLLCGCNF